MEQVFLKSCRCPNRTVKKECPTHEQHLFGRTGRTATARYASDQKAALTTILYEVYILLRFGVATPLVEHMNVVDCLWTHNLNCRPETDVRPHFVWWTKENQAVKFIRITACLVLLWMEYTKNPATENLCCIQHWNYLEEQRWYLVLCPAIWFIDQDREALKLPTDEKNCPWSSVYCPKKSGFLSNWVALFSRWFETPGEVPGRGSGDPNLWNVGY